MKPQERGHKQRAAGPSKPAAPPKVEDAFPLEELQEPLFAEPLADDTLESAELVGPSRSCDNCGASLAAEAVLCVECGFDLRHGRVLTRQTAPSKKKKAGAGLNFKSPPVLIGIAAAVVVLVGVGIFMATRGGSAGAPSTSAAAPAGAGAGAGADAGAPAAPGAALPMASANASDWQKSLPALAANLKGELTQDKTGQPRWQLHSGEFRLADDGPEVVWEGVVMGRDRRPIASFASPGAARQAFGFGFPQVATLPEPFAVLFSIDQNRASELLALTYRRVRIKGRFDAAARIVWLDKNDRYASSAAGPSLQGTEPTYLDWPDGEGVKPIYVMWLQVTSFERVN